MMSRRISPLIMAGLLALPLLGASRASAEDVRGTVKRVDTRRNQLIIVSPGLHDEVRVPIASGAQMKTKDGHAVDLSSLRPGTRVRITPAPVASDITVEPEEPSRPFLEEFWHNFTHNLFKPLLLFFYLGFLVPILRVKFEFPYVMYQALTIYLLLAIGWHGGEELAQLDPKLFGSVVGFMGVGFLTNTVIGLLAYLLLSVLTRMRRVDKATVAGYYGSDSAGTFVTALGVLGTVHIAFDAYMPVMLAVMEIPGCLVALYLVSRLRHQGMDPAGTMPDEPGYDPNAKPALASGLDNNGHGPVDSEEVVEAPPPEQEEAYEQERELALEKRHRPTRYGRPPRRLFSAKLLHEVFLNPGLYLLFGGIIIGFISRMQGPDVVRDDDNFFVTLFQGVLCLFLLEMGMTAARKLRDLRTAGAGFIAYALLAPPVFATIGILVAHGYAHFTHNEFQLGTYVLFSVLCAAASYIAVPAVQRLAIPEASPTLPLAASLGLTFSFNVTVGIPLYIQIAKAVLQMWPLH
jgi:hypothetical protein